MNIRLTQLDGDLPNLALMKLAHWHKAQGNQVTLTRSVYRTFFEPEHYDAVFASTIFSSSRFTVGLFLKEWPGAMVGGTGVDPHGMLTVESIIGSEYEHYDYSLLPRFTASIGYTQRGCRMAGPKSPCRKFCYVPEKEGFPKAVNTIADIWRGKPWPRKIHLLDNDFFGNPEWRDRVRELREGGFRVCFSQGINTRLITEEAAQALSTLQYRDTKFQQRRLYTAWDNIGDEKVFFDGVDRLERAGIPPKHLMTFMLIGCDPAETWERLWYRFKKMVDRGILPFPMLFDQTRADLKCFQRWVNTGLYRVPDAAWPIYKRETKTQESVEGYHGVYGRS